MKTRKQLLPLATLAGLALAATSAQAASIAITNHSFEAQVLGAPPGDTVLGVTGWTTFSGNPGTGRTSPAQYAGGVDGNNYAWTNNTSGIQDTLSQTLGVDLQANTTYTLTVAVGWRADLPGLGYTTFPGYGIELYAGGILVASDYDTTNGGTGTNPASGAWTDATATFTSAPSVTPGQALEIRLVGFFEPANPNGWGVQTNYDNVRLEAIPEPSSAALLGLGGLALLRRRRK